MPNLRLQSITQADCAIMAPLMDEEERAWMVELDWDYSPIRKILTTFLSQRLLPGYVAMEGERARGYLYFLLQGDKAVIGTLYASNPDGQDVADGILSQAAHWLKESQNIRRIEAQIFPLNNLDLTTIFVRNGFDHYQRHYLELNLSSSAWHKNQSCDEEIVRWDSSFQNLAAEVVLGSYSNEIDAVICEDYCSKSGCESYLRSLVENPGCGIFIKDASFIGLDRRGVPCGFVMSSRISPESAMIPQISVHPSHQGRGLGTALINRSLKMLQTMGFSSVRLTVTRQNRRAYEWYQRLGFDSRSSFGAYIWQRSY